MDIREQYRTACRYFRSDTFDEKAPHANLMQGFDPVAIGNAWKSHYAEWDYVEPYKKNRYLDLMQAKRRHRFARAVWIKYGDGDWKPSRDWQEFVAEEKQKYKRG